ncbi:conserved membrane hypothetical protein [Cupriavidus phytorum]|uniref:DUF2029 domain-containing protein n=2 Tax=Cupriavidus TaxID=106589 RepID=A0A375B975_9BURK|nr:MULTISPECIES: DUF2029 domain-containing protein [Cupriavidus]PZX25468.1 uncharacterized protein DUF2029 [Cupriavidus alkaliphilus]SOY40218.1 conserved membrane hypothetical protein [Cupriavidus taiwanensis]
MRLLAATLPRLAALVARLSAPNAPTWACLLVPFGFGLYALKLGQDRNWDLLNYHLYNPYALLTGRVGLDLAPAQLQSYFNPLLDVPYFLMTKYLPAPLAGFAMGLLHGAAFVLVYGIASALLVSAQQDRARQARQRLTAMLLALAGCLGPAYLSELGNTMGDNATALFVLAGFLVLVRKRDALAGPGRAGWLHAAAAGMLVGAAAGLKLTNALYAVAMCLACLFLAQHWLRRLGLAWWFGVGVLAGIAVTSGYWFAMLWETFRNPLFPQFNGVFGNPLAAPISVADTRWLPRSVSEALLFPFVMVLKAQRVGELPTRPFVWPVLYLLAGAWLVQRACRAAGAGSPRADCGRPPLAAAARALLVFLLASYLVWLGLFSIYRYCVAMELLAPLAAWILMQQLLPSKSAGRAGAMVLLVATLASMATSHTWEHASWARQAFRVTLPAAPLDAGTSVFFVGGRVPQAWMAPYFPASVRFGALSSNFPEGHGFRARLDDMLAGRGGAAYAVIPAAVNPRERMVARWNTMLAGTGMRAGTSWCSTLESIAQKVRLRARVAQGIMAGQPCTLELLPRDRRDLAAENLAEARTHAADLVRYGLTLEPGACQTYEAFIGDQPVPYQFCPLSAPNARRTAD